MEKRLIYREILVLLVFGIIIPSFDSVSDTGRVVTSTAFRIFLMPTVI